MRLIIFKKIRFCIILIFLFSSSVWPSEISEPGDTLKVYPFDPVVVTGTRIKSPKADIPLSISIIPERVIEEQKCIPLLDLVSQNVPGLFVTRRTNIGYGVASGSAGQISIRGIGSFPNTQVLVLIDGRPDVMGLFGHPISDAYFLQDVEKIEVIRGPASLLYGSNAMGGAINIIPKHSRKRGFHINIPLRYGSFNSKYAAINHSFDRENFGYSISLGSRNSDGFRTKGNDSYRSESGNFEFHSNLSENFTVLINSYLSNLEVYDPRLTTAPSDTDWYDIKRRGGDVTIMHEIGKFIGDIKIHHNYGHHKVFDGYKSDDFTTGFIATETYRPNNSLRFLLGIDIREYGGKALLDSSWEKYEVDEMSVVAHLHQKFFQRFNLDGGVRLTKHSIAGNEVIPSVGVSALLPYDFNIKAQYSKGYRNPTINELYLFTGPFMPSTTDLKPEILHNIEATIEKRYRELFSTSVTVFQIDAENMIEKTISAQGKPLYQNVGNAEIAGIEWEGQWLLPPNLAINWTASTSSYSTTLAGSPGTKVGLSLRYTPFKNTFLTLQGQWINNLYSVEDPYSYKALTYVRLDPYVIIDLRCNCKLKKYLDLYCQIENINDFDYETMYHFPMPGRTFTFGITAKY